MDLLRPVIRAGAATFAAAVPVFALAGAAWGLLRPSVDVLVDAEGRPGISATAGADAFPSWAGLVAATALLSLVTALAAFRTSPAARGATMVTWVAVVAAVGVGAFFVVGDRVAVALADLPHAVPLPVHLGAAPVVTAAFCAALAYWCALAADPAAGAPGSHG